MDLLQYLHDRQHGYLHMKNTADIMWEIEYLPSLAPEDVPEVTPFLLEINFTELSKFHIETQKYWTLAVKAARTAQELHLARGARVKQAKQKVNARIASRKKLGIVASSRSGQRVCIGEHHRMTQSRINTRRYQSIALPPNALTQPPLQEPSDLTSIYANQTDTV
jgi:hypothetical protein